jgi:hypothetical protein
MSKHDCPYQWCERFKAKNDPTVAVFVRGGLVDAVCFDGLVRVVVVDFDCDADRGSIFIDPDDGRASRAYARIWPSADPDNVGLPYVRAAVRAATDPLAPLRDNEEERARIHREIEENDDGC